jgi:hypothetical protein
MAARNRRKFLTPHDIEVEERALRIDDLGGRGQDLDDVDREEVMSAPVPSHAIEETVPLSERLPSSKLLAFDGVAACTAGDVEAAKMIEIMGLIYVRPSLGEVQRQALYVKAIDLFESLKPADGIEGMLATQMVGTHNAAVESLRRAMVYNQSLEAHKVYLSQAERMMGMYMRQVDALAKHRGKAQPNITVGQVNVESGGRAIVGNVAAGVGSAAPAPSPPSIAEADTQSPTVDLEKPARRKARQ